jgi:hypothetical protein
MNNGPYSDLHLLFVIFQIRMLALSSPSHQIRLPHN